MPLHTNHQPARVSSTAPHLAGEGRMSSPLVALSPAFSIHPSDQSQTEKTNAKSAVHVIFEEHLIDGRRLALQGAGHQPFLTINDEAPSESVADEISDPIQNSDGRPATRSFDCRHTPSPAAWRAVFSYANPSQAHAATRLHGASR